MDDRGVSSGDDHPAFPTLFDCAYVTAVTILWDPVVAHVRRGAIEGPCAACLRASCCGLYLEGGLCCVWGAGVWPSPHSHLATGISHLYLSRIPRRSAASFPQDAPLHRTLPHLCHLLPGGCTAARRQKKCTCTISRAAAYNLHWVCSDPHHIPEPRRIPDSHRVHRFPDPHRFPCMVTIHTMHHMLTFASYAGAPPVTRSLGLDADTVITIRQRSPVLGFFNRVGRGNDLRDCHQASSNTLQHLVF